MTATADPLALEYAARMFEPPRRRWATPGQLALQIDRGTVQTPALDLIDAALVRLMAQPDGRLIISMPPQEGKSVRVAGVFPVWALHTDPDLRVVVASYGERLAARNGRAIRSRIVQNAELLGLQLAADQRAVGEWSLAGHAGGLHAAGIGSALTGFPADLMVIDDPIKDRREADSPTYRENVWDWWTDVASTRLAPGAPVVLILTRWHEDDLAGRLLAEEGSEWEYLNIPAEADHKPEEGESDPLGREPGEFMVSARGRTLEQWLRRKRTAGSRTWASLFQGRPSPAGGNILQRAWWQRYSTPLAIRRDDGSYWLPMPGDPTSYEVVQSWDMAFKDLASSDWVVGQVWMRRGPDAFLLDQVRRRMGFVETCAAVVELSARWPQAVAKLVEDKANGPAVMNSLQRRLPGLVPIEPEGSKTARAYAISPLVEAGNVWLPDSELAPWADELIEEATAFPNGANDDQVDALTQAVNRVLLHPILAGDDLVEPEELDEDLAYSIAPY